MKVKIKYMLWLSDKAGTSAEELSIEGREEITLRDLLLELTNYKPKLAKTIHEAITGSSEIIILVNSKTPNQNLETIIKNGDEIVLMPPVSGG